MGAKVVEYVEASQIYATNYIRNSKAIAVLWSIFTICYSIIVIVSFITPGKWIILIYDQIFGTKYLMLTPQQIGLVT
jgi:hypothetical protein